MPHQNLEALRSNARAAGIDTSLTYRAMSMPIKMKDGMPESWDDTTRSVEMIGATENPCMVFDWDQWEFVPEVLRMDGCQLPGNGQVPLLDTHIRCDTSSVLGSYREMRCEGTQMLGR